MKISYLSVTTIAFLLCVVWSPVFSQDQNHEHDHGHEHGEDHVHQEGGSHSASPLKAIIVDGQNKYHPHWPKTTQMMKQYLEESGRFSVDVERTKYLLQGELAKEFPLDDGKEYEFLDIGKTDPDFAPQWSDYDVVVLNQGFGAAEWPEQTKTAFEKYMAEGGGLVVVHAADNCFPQWKEFNLMTGLGGWGDRSEKDGPYVYYDQEQELVRDDSKGSGGGHGPQHTYEIVVRAEHPITAGLPTSWMHAQDELYQQLRGPAENMTVLATAWADKEFKGTDRHEPLIMTVAYKKGRTFHLALGHADYSFECVGFITVFKRGTEWAATGEVTMKEVPNDFPGTEEPSTRKFEFKEMAGAN